MLYKICLVIIIKIIIFSIIARKLQSD